MSDRKMCDQCGAIMPSGDTFDICEACERSLDDNDDAATIDTGGPQSWL